jgi:hypothetical protein
MQECSHIVVYFLLQLSVEHEEEEDDDDAFKCVIVI